MDNVTFSLLLENVGADIRFDYFNASKNIKPSSFSFHSHTVYEVYFIESGEMEVCLGDEVLKLREHDILIISPNTVHRVKQCSDSLKRFNLRFLLYAEAESQSPYFLYEQTHAIRNEIYSDIEKIHLHMPYLDQPWEFFRVKNYFSVILSYIVEALLSSQTSKVKKHAFRSNNKSKIDQHIQIDRFFSENYSRAITVENLAEELHYSKTHVNRLLKHDWGMTFSEKLNQTRLQAANQYLRDSHEPIHRIAELCGYSTLRGFEIFFKKHTGVLPKEYRKKHNNCFHKFETM